MSWRALHSFHFVWFVRKIKTQFICDAYVGTVFLFGILLMILLSYSNVFVLSYIVFIYYVGFFQICTHATHLFFFLLMVLKTVVRATELLWPISFLRGSLKFKSINFVNGAVISSTACHHQ